MLQLPVLEGASNGALSPWVEQDISPGWKETNWACLEHSHFATRWMCACVWLYKGNRVCVRLYVYYLTGVKVSICVHSSTRLVSQHLSDYMYRRASYLSDFPRALRRASHSESRDLYQIHHRLREEKPDAGIDFHLPAQQTDPEGGKKRLLPPQWLETPSKSMWLPSLFAVSSGWSDAQVEEEEEEEGVLVFGEWRKRRKKERNALTFTGLHIDGPIPFGNTSASARHKEAELLKTVPKQLDEGKLNIALAWRVFSRKDFPSGRWGPASPSLIFLHFGLLVTLLCLSRAGWENEHICLPLSITFHW